jgi:hypothetical protein
MVNKKRSRVPVLPAFFLRPLMIISPFRRRPQQQPEFLAITALAVFVPCAEDGIMAIFL